MLTPFIRGLSSRSIAVAFAVVFGGALLAALLPPLYLAASGVRATVVGVPFAIAYWVIDALVLGLGLWAYYALEHVRGELDDEDIDTVADGAESAQVALS